MVPFRRLAVVGVGLIGGSCALALKQARAVERVVGIGRSRGNLERALALGVIDEIAPTPADGLEGADAALFAVPVGQFAKVIRDALPAIGPDTVLTDGGSTKQDVVAVARAQLGGRLSRFVPAHPIAGAEHSGVEAARADLYAGRNVVLTPLPETDPAATARTRALWAACGARVTEMSPAEHDAVFAAVSHLPHALAFALVEMLAARPEAPRLFEYAAGGFRDFTRIASSSPEMWRDICVANRDALVSELDAFSAALAEMRRAVAAGDAAQLEAAFTRARDARNAWLRTRETAR
ncbi:MAG: prephenate dehydrogenase/arogenate dehydrogenase family protein [Burkholderiales bacterium]